MKSQLCSAIVALSAFAAINIVSTSAHAQQQGGAIIGPQGGVVVQPQGVTLTPGAPSPGANGANANGAATGGAVPPAQYHAPMGEQKADVLRPNMPLLATGGLTFLAAYVPSFIVAIGSDHDDDKWLYLPVAGPFIDLASRGCGDGPQTSTCGTTAWERGALIASGAVQTIGAAMMVGSFFTTSRRIATGAVDKPTLQITPVTLGSSRAPGLMAIGTF